MDDGGRRQQRTEQQLLQAIQQMADVQGKALPWASNNGPSWQPARGGCETTPVES
jgi:hypothetical protein